MKFVKLIAILAVLFAVGAGLGAVLPEQWRQNLSFRSPSSMKVGVVRIRPVLDVQWRRMLAADNSDPQFQEFQAKARAMQQTMDMNKCRFSKEMENLKAEYAGGLAKWHEQRRKEIEGAVKVVANDGGYHLVYCDAAEVEHWTDLQCHFSQYVNNNTWTPACLLPSDDVTDQVIATMKP